VIALLVVIVALVAAHSMPAELLTVLPALAFGLLMMVRPYLGEKAIARLRGTPRARRPLPPCLPRVHERCGDAVRGGRLIAAALAGRAPPALLARPS
jgi:hypothetical protein